MKPTLKKLACVLGLSLSAVSFTGCEADAEETKPAGTNQAASSSSVVQPSIGANTVLADPQPANASLFTEIKDEASAPASTTTNTVAEQATEVKTIPPTLPPNVRLSKGVEEIVKLAQSGLGETVILLFIEKYPEPFDVDAAEIVYLNDIGISSTVLTAMLTHDGAGPELQAALTNKVDLAAVPPTAPNTNFAPPTPLQPAPLPYDLSSNYVAAPGPAMDPNAQLQYQYQQQPVVVEQPVVVTEPEVTYSYFYSSLSPYGSWVYVNDYGYCWQPTIAVVNTGWRPYCHGGSWLYSNSGWYWHSDYSWGWAPFHYGRWTCAPRYGWVWTPDYTWGASWVTWRQSGDYCGWAPLPPHCDVRPGVGFSYWNRNVGFSYGFGYGHEHYTFVPTKNFAHGRVMDHVVPTERTTNIYKDSTVVNNYIVGNNNTIINNGISKDYVAARSRSEVPKVTIRDEPRGTRPLAPDRIQKSGNEMVVYRPTAPTPQAQAALRQGQEQMRPTMGASGEAARPTGASSLSSGISNLGAENHRAISSGTLAPRGEAIRPSTLARTEAPAFATPAPVRPEPEPSINALRASRTTMESLRRSPITTVQPGANSSANLRPSVGTTDPRPSGSIQAEGTRVTPNIPTAARSEIARREATSINSGLRSAPDTTVTAPSQASSGNTIARPSSGFPIARPLSGNLAARPIAESGVNQSPPAVTATPRFSPQPGSIGSAPQSIRPQNAAPQSAPAMSAPSISPPRPITSRSEGFGASRPPAPAIQVPSSIGPVYSQGPAPAISAPAPRAFAPAPVVRSESPRGNVGSSPVSGGQVNSAPPAAAARPNVVQQSGGAASTSGRGRLEIGR